MHDHLGLELLRRGTEQFFTNSPPRLKGGIDGMQRPHTDDTVRTYIEILYDWFDALEESDIAWAGVDGADLVAYRNRVLHPVRSPD